MAVTAKFVPDRIEVLPNTPTTMTLRLYNGDDESARGVTGHVGDLSEHVRLDSDDRTHSSPTRSSTCQVTVFAPSSLQAGTYTIDVEATVGTGEAQPPVDGANSGSVAAPEVVTASGTAEISAHSDYTMALRPVVSKGARGGRHAIRVANTGNVALLLEVSAGSARTTST